MEDARERRSKSQSDVKRSSSRLSQKLDMSSEEDKNSNSSKKFKSNEIDVTQSCQQPDKPESRGAPKELEKICVLPSNWCITQVSASSHSHGWSVQNFSLLNHKNGEGLCSSTFKIPQLPNLECNLLLYPNGHEEKCKDNTCIVFQCLAQDSLNINCQLQFYNKSGTFLFSAKDCRIRTCSKELTSSEFHCVKTKSRLIFRLKDDELLIGCVLSINENVIFNKTSGDSGGHDSQDLPNKLELLSDLEKLLREKKCSDVALRIEDQVFHAHKSILVARSSFFKKLFEHYKNEEHKEYNINNVSTSTFEKILHFIYTGKISDINNSAGDLLEAASEFKLSDLKTICERHLMNTLWINNVCQNLMLAEKLNATDLKKKAMNLIFAFKDQIIDSADFELVRNFSSNLYQEILCFVLCDGNI